MEKMGLRSAQFILALACATNTTYGMLDSVRNKVAVARSAIAQLYGKYYNYLTDLPNMTFTDVKQRISGKPTSKEMFGLVEQFLKDGTGFDALIQNIRSGAYDAIINERQRYVIEQGRSAEDATILDMFLSKLIHSDVFGTSPGLYSVKHPESLPTFSDFFQPKVTFQLIELVKALFERGANTRTTIPLFKMEMMIEYYGFITKALLPKNPSTEQQSFLDAFKSLIDLFYNANKQSIDEWMKNYEDGQSYTAFFKQVVDSTFIPSSVFKRGAAWDGYRKAKDEYQKTWDEFQKTIFGGTLSEEREALQVLGLQTGVSKAEIKKQYYKLAREFHPDRMQGKSEKEKNEAEERFKKISNAYELLIAVP